jgi:hypothetical protein
MADEAVTERRRRVRATAAGRRRGRAPPRAGKPPPAAERTSDSSASPLEVDGEDGEWATREGWEWRTVGETRAGAELQPPRSHLMTPELRVDRVCRASDLFARPPLKTPSEVIDEVTAERASASHAFGIRKIVSISDDRGVPMLLCELLDKPEPQWCPLVLVSMIVPEMVCQFLAHAEAMLTGRDI